MFSHVYIGTNDLDRAVGFYSDVLAPLSVTLKFREEPRHWAGWFGAAARPLFIVGRPANGAPHQPGNGQMVAFLAGSRAEVRVCHARALAAGGTDEGMPGIRPEYHTDYYGAYFRDPDGNKVCICCHEADEP